MIIKIELPDNTACGALQYFCADPGGGATVRGLTLNDIENGKEYTYKPKQDETSFAVGECAECEYYHPEIDEEWPCSHPEGMPTPEPDDFCSMFDRRKNEH